ncbi:MAG: single-stranded DNA-binding protein [Flavobacteriales bacterium]|nr:single-stranded DNA-binding protein [Flavobacteriales bacterium]
MAGGVNKVILIGNLGTDPEVKTLTSGTKVARLRIATSESYTNKEGERVTNTEWHSVNLWRGLAEVAEKYLKTGNTIYVEGKLRTRSYDDKDGVTRYVTEIEGDNMTMLGGRNDGGGSAPSQGSSPAASQPAPKQQATKPTESAPDADDDDLPF